MMQITITRSLSVADELTDINALEGAIREAGQCAMAEALALAWQQYQADAPACCRCQSGHTVADGIRPYQLRTVFGTVELRRQRRRCRDCGAVYQPLDEVLHAAGPGRATAVLAGSSWPFATAAEVLGRLSGHLFQLIALGYGGGHDAMTQEQDNAKRNTVSIRG